MAETVEGRSRVALAPPQESSRSEAQTMPTTKMITRDMSRKLLKVRIKIKQSFFGVR
jgi:hypothetical protein